jgi:hypothetical protein
MLSGVSLEDNIESLFQSPEGRLKSSLGQPDSGIVRSNNALGFDDNEAWLSGSAGQENSEVPNVYIN